MKNLGSNSSGTDATTNVTGYHQCYVGIGRKLTSTGLRRFLIQTLVTLGRKREFNKATNLSLLLKIRKVYLSS
jgi:hypothetical protein